MIDQRNAAPADGALSGEPAHGLSDALPQLADQVVQTARAGLDVVRDGTRSLGEQAHKVGDHTLDYIRQEPLKAVLIAAALGAAAVVLSGLMRRR